MDLNIKDKGFLNTCQALSANFIPYPFYFYTF